MYDIPIYHARDTPLRSLYRLFEDICASDFITSAHSFFVYSEPRWALACILNPRDNDPVRYVFLANMVGALVDAFN